jgi:hypothetical protein
MISFMFPEVIEMAPSLHHKILLKNTPHNGVTKDANTSQIL